MIINSSNVAAQWSSRHCVSTAILASLSGLQSSGKGVSSYHSWMENPSAVCLDVLKTVASGWRQADCLTANVENNNKPWLVKVLWQNAMKAKVFCTELGHSVVVLIAMFSLAFWKKVIFNTKWQVDGHRNNIESSKNIYLGCHSSWTSSTTGIELKLSTKVKSHLPVL